MSIDTTKFVIYGLFCVGSLCGGYTARKRRWVDERWSRTIHFHTVVWVWSLAAMLSLWRIPVRTENLWLLAIQPVLMGVTAYGMIPVAKWMGCNRTQTGVMALAAGVSNNGFTLGAYICYTLLDPPVEALAYAIAFVTTNAITAVVLLYPLARHYGQGHGEDVWTVRSVMKSFLDLRAMSLYTASLGVALAVMEVPVPGVVDRWHIIDGLFYVGALGGYVGIGLRLRLGDGLVYIRQHAVLAVLKFAVIPILALMMLQAIGLTPWPLGPLAGQVVQIQAFMPAAILSVMLANLFHLDARMASVVWVWNTVIFLVIPLPVIIWLVG